MKNTASVMRKRPSFTGAEGKRSSRVNLTSLRTTAKNCSFDASSPDLTDKLARQRSTGSASKSVPLTWVDVLSLPLPANTSPSRVNKEEEKHR